MERSGRGYEKVLVRKRVRVEEPKVGCHIRAATTSYHHSTSCLAIVSTCGTAVLWSSPVENLCDHNRWQSVLPPDGRVS